MENELLKSVINLAASNRFAIGNDLVFIPDFELSLTTQFKDKVYTDAETAYCEKFADALQRYASTWAAKEAVYKAVKQIYPEAMGWKKIEIIREKPAGRPYVILHSQTAGALNISLSLSHDGQYVWAVAFIEIV